MTPGDPADEDDRLTAAARRAVESRKQGADNPEPSLGSRLGQIGILGWTIIVPTLIGVVAGRWLDRTFDGGIFFTAPLIMLGAAFGLWSAWKWMNRT